MHLRISHLSRYRYSNAVWLEPHVLRLRPRCDGSQRLSAFTLDIDPRPHGWSEWMDIEGNAAASAWFDTACESLTVRTSFEIETLRQNPFDFLLDGRAAALPVQFSPVEELALAVYRRRRWSDREIDSFAGDVLYASGELTTFFLSELARELHARSSVTPQTPAAPLPPLETLERRGGSCRDLALLYVETCRAVGLPARFVTGYHLPFTAEGERLLHAWAEVYLPGAGWRGFDPTSGLAVSDQHVVVAAAAEPQDAIPISGAFRSRSARSELEVRIDIVPA